MSENFKELKMTTGFSLYDNLLKGLPKGDLKVCEKEEFVKNIIDLDKNGQELVYALIIVYFRNNSKSSKEEEVVPYKGIRTENSDGDYNFGWTFSSFPLKLRKLLFKFIKIHMKNKLEDESLRA